ncbi:interaptin isoform X1 [Ceratitis capitata]|uniref:interaptin isoform X1 n=1 Tax=Ceratitis capitata TaxID=7213 RepID=UPI000618859D|nr:interaptin isoform X1 [Ceratitis capitata]
MSQNPSKNPNMSGKLRNTTNITSNPNACPQVRGRAVNRQFRLISRTGAHENEEDVPTNAPPAILNIVVPSHIGSETSVVSSRTNAAALNVVTKSSLPSAISDARDYDYDSQYPEIDEWIEKSHSSIRSSTKKCQSKTLKTEKHFSKEETLDSRPLAPKSCPPCKSPQHDVNFLKQRLVQYRAETESCGDAAKLNGQLNEIFVRRLVDIENVAKGDMDVKLTTYQEWVNLLLQINETIIGNMTDLESEVAERLECMKRRIQSSCSQTSNNEQKYRQDICSLMKLLKNAYQYDNWDIQGLEFQTVNLNEILGTRNTTCSDPERPRNTRHDYYDDDQESRNRCCLNEPECVLENVIFEPPDARCGRKVQPTEMTDCTSSCVNDCNAKCSEEVLEKPSCSNVEINTDYSLEPRTKTSCVSQDNNNANLRALAVEVAAKHDEICDLRRQIACLEDEIQKAQQKIQLKDNVINHLRNDLKYVNTKLTPNDGSSLCGGCGGELTDYSMPPINVDHQSTPSTSTQVSAGQESCNQLQFVADCLSSASNVEQQKLKALDVELNELFQVTHEFKSQNLEYHRKRLSDILQKSEAEKAEAYRKLDSIRKQLISIEISSGKQSKNSFNDSDSGFSSKCDSDQDAKILDTLRNRLQRLKENNFELQGRVQALKIENNAEYQTCLKTEQTFAQRNSNTLKDLADMLCGMSGEQFCYNDIYNTNSDSNPFCKAIIKMKCEYEEKERKLMNNLSMKCEQLAELQKSLLCNEHDLEQLHHSAQLNENLRCQVQHLQCTILEKEQHIGKLNNLLEKLQCDQQQHQHRTNECCLQAKDNEIREISQKLDQANKKVESLMGELERSQKQERFLLCETRKLNEELNESKRKHGDLSVQMHRLNALLKSQNDCRSDICKKYEELERNYEDQAKQLRAACTQMNCLQDRLALMDKRQEEHNMERNLLRDEVLALKEKEATLLNKERCQTDQLMKIEKELYTAHDVMKEQQRIMQRSESTQRDCTKRLQEANNELKRQFNKLCDDYKQLENEYRKQCDLRKQNEKVIDSFRKWKEAQLKADDATRASFKQYEEHIKLLLEEKQKFLEQYRSLHGDYCALQHELERIKMCSYSSFNNSGTGSKMSENSMPQRIELIRSTSLRVSQKSSSLKCDDTSQEASGSNPL